MPDAASPAPPRFVAVGHHGLRLASEDGVVWKDIQVGKEGETYRAVAHGNGRFVAVGSYGGSNLFAASPDGVTWQTAQKDAQYSAYLRAVGFARGEFLALGGDPGAVGDSKPFGMTTADGVSWGANLPFAGKELLRRFAFGAGRYVAVGDRGRRSASTDGRDWKDAPGVKAIDTLIDVAFGAGPGVFVGVGLHGLRMRTVDGLAWTDRQLGEEGEHLNSVLWAGDRFVAVGQGATYTSRDGAAWSRAPNRDAPLTVAHGRGVFVGAAWKGRLLRSADGVAWEPAFKADHHVEALAFGG